MSLLNKQSGYKKHDPELDAIMASLRKAADMMAHLGRQQAKRPEDITEAYWQVIVYNELKTLVDHAIGRIQIAYNPPTSSTTVSHAGSVQDTKMDALDKDIENSEKDERNLKYDVENTHIDDGKTWTWWLTHAYSVVASIIDGYLGYDAFQSGQVSVIMSLLYAALIGGLTYLGSRVAVLWAMAAESAAVRRIRKLLVIIGAAIVFHGLALGRAYFMNRHEVVQVAPGEISLPDTTGFSPGAVGFMAWVFFVTSFWFSLATYRLPEVVAQHTELRKKNKKLKAIRKAIVRMKANKFAIMQTQRDEAVQKEAGHNAAIGLAKQVLALANHAAGEFAKEYSSNRKGGNIPSFLTTPPFQFPTNKTNQP